MKVDLHCHSTFSDGLFSVEELINTAAENKVTMLSITDHDISCLRASDFDLAKAKGIQLIPGVEFSSQWSGASIHVVGLAVDVNTLVFQQALKIQHENRVNRAREIAAKLEKKGLHGAFEGATILAGDGQIGRPHFARYLAETNQVKDVSQAFKKYLGAGKVGDINAIWPSLETVVGWIHEAKGVAVLAHPARYKFSLSKLRCLCDDFKKTGGQALEVVSGNQPTKRAASLVGLCNEFQFYASCGSDFHGPVSKWSDIGKMPPFPKECQPVWELFDY